MESKSRVEYSVLNIATGMGGYIVNTILGFICRMVFVRCLAADYLGVSGLFTNVLSMLSLAELGIGSAVVYALYKPLAENDERKIASLVEFYGKAYRSIGIFIAVMGLALMPFLNVIIRDAPNIKESIYLLYLIYLFNTSSTYFFSYRSSLIIAAQQNYIVGGISYIIAIIQSILQMIYLLITREYIGYLLIQTTGTFIYNVLISHIAVKKFPYIKGKDIQPLKEDERKSLFRDIKDLTVYKLSGLLVNSTDNIITTFFNGLATTGLASNYTLLTTTLNSLLNQIFNGLTASIGNYNVTETKERQYGMFKFLNMMNFWIFSWASIGILFVSSDLVKLCFGENYVLGLEIPFVIALNFYTVGMQNAVWTFKQTLGLFRYGKYTQIFTALINIVFSVLLGYRYGLFGILLATFIARVFTNLWYDPYVVYKHGFFRKPIEYLFKYFKYLMLMIVNIGICGFLCSIVNTNLIFSILIKCIICSVIPNVIYILLFYTTSEFKYLLNLLEKVINILRKKLKINKKNIILGVSMKNNIKIVNIRALAIILVVLGHSIILYSSQWDLYTTINSVPILDNFKKVIDIIQMPLFFSISGFLFYYSINKKRSFFKFIKNKFFRLIVPYVCIAVIWMIPIRVLIGYKGYSDMSIKHIIINSVLYGVDCGHLWFLPTLFLIFIEMYFITYIITKLNSNKFIDFAILLIFILLSNICFRIPNIIPFTSKSFEFLVWFYIGYLFNKYENNLLTLNKFKYIQIVLLICSLVYWWIFGGFISALITKILMLLNIYELMSSKNNKYVELVSNNSFGIYLFHSPLIYITFSYIPNSSPIFVVILNFVVFGGLALLITLFIKKTRLKFIIGE